MATHTTTAKSSSDPAAIPDSACWRFGDVSFDERTLELTLRGELRPLPPKPLEVLMVLLRRPGEVVTKEELFEAVWPRRIVSEGSLTNAIGKLRSAIGDEQQQIIKSTHGHGYRLMSKVVRETPLPSPAAVPVFHFEPGGAVPLRADWQFDSRLGAGGQGEVWLATHRATQEKRVFKFARDDASLIGLKREVTLFRLLRESLGKRNDLVQLLDWNLDQTPCFIASEWCPGGSLTDWALARGGLKQVPLEQRVELIAQTADALSATHALGALHKDVKPGNVLIAMDDEERPQIRLADFGSARLLRRSDLVVPDISHMGLTQTVGASTGGTPLYLAPELIAGQPPTPQSDIYSLGVMLYQIVVGDLRKPLAPGWESEVSDELLREDIARAAAGDPAQRLDEAAQLAIRLRSLAQRRADRAREHQLQAQADAAHQALERNLARRGLLRALGATMALGLIVTSVLLWQAVQAKREAHSAAARAQAVTEFLSQDLLTSANPVVAGRRDVTVRELLDGAVQQLGPRFADQPYTLASLQSLIGAAYAAMGEKEQAEALLNPSITALGALVGPAARETQNARTALRDMYVNVGEFGPAIRMGATIAAAEAQAGKPNPDIAVENEAMAAIGSCWARYISEAVARCEDVAREQYARVRRELGPDHLGTARTGVYAGTALMRVGRYTEALPILRAAVDGLRGKLGADNLWLFQADGLLTEALTGAGRFEEALERQVRVLEISNRIYGPASRLTRVSRRWVASSRLELGQVDLAAQELEALSEEMRARGDANPRDVSLVSLALAKAETSRKRPADAESALRAALARVAPLEPDGGYWTLRLREALADNRLAQTAVAETEALHRQNLADARRLLTHGEWLAAWCAYRLGDFLAAQGREAEAGPLLLEAAKGLEDSLGADDPRTQQARRSIGTRAPAGAGNAARRDLHPSRG